MPMVWVDGRASPDATQLQTRLTTTGKYLNQLSKDALAQVYGQMRARWIYSSQAFFLRIIVDAPSLMSPVAVPALRTEFTVCFSLNDAAVRLLRMITDCKRVLLHFDAEPEWVQPLPPLQNNERARDLGKPGAELARSSLIVIFRPDLITRMAAWLEICAPRATNFGNPV